MPSVQSQHEKKCPLPAPRRYISTHTEDGSSVFYTDLPPELPHQVIREDLEFYLAWTTSTFPIDITNEGDIDRYRQFLEGDKPGLTNKGGSVLRVTDFGPRSYLEPPMHRTISVDFGIVTSGEIESVLDSGERRLLRAGDIMIQRETNHAWRNPSPDKWVRMVFILSEAKPIQMGGKDLTEDYGEIPNLNPST